MRTGVAIIGGGPSGLLLSLLLTVSGIENIILERKSKADVLARIRAGVLEPGLVALLDRAGVAGRLHREGFRHDGVLIHDGTTALRIDFKQSTGSGVTVYGQTEVTRDLYARHEASGGTIRFGVEDARLFDIDTAAPFVTFTLDGALVRLDADFVVGCDGFHGVSRSAIPETVRRDHSQTLSVSWLGVLSATPPVHDELIYSSSDRGFALCSMRNRNLSRYYIQCPTGDTAASWSDEAFWDELRLRIPPEYAARLVTGPSLEKSVIPLRSFLTEPMQWGRLFLCGDAAHIFPPTGAKGLNAAGLDVAELHAALAQFYATGSTTGLETYSTVALERTRKMQRFSLWFTRLLHRFPGETDADARERTAALAHLHESPEAQKAFAENYVGLRR